MDRLTHERVNGIKPGYWSPATKEAVVQRLAFYENAVERGELIWKEGKTSVNSETDIGDH